MADQKQSATEELGVRTAKAASLLISGRFISIVISAAMFIIVARLLQPHNYGIYILIMSAATIIGTFGNPNLGNYLKEKIPRLASSKKAGGPGVLLADAFLLSVAIGTILLLIGVALGNLISTYFLQATTYNLALDIGFISILLNLLYSTFNDALISVGKSGSAASAAILHSIAQALASVLLVLAGYGIIGALLGYSIGLLLSSGLEVYLANRKYRLHFELKGMLSRFHVAIGFSKYLTLSGIISGILTNISNVYLGFFVLPAVIGDYGIAQKVLSAIDVITGSIALALIPMFSEAQYRRRSGIEPGKLFYYSIYLSFLVATPVVAYITIFSHDLILLLFSSTYLGATLYMQLVVLSILVSVFYVYGTNFVIGVGKPDKVLKYAVITSIITLASMVVLTKYFGVVGTIISIFYIGSIVPDILYLNYLIAHGSKIDVQKILRVILANVVPAIPLVAMVLLGVFPVLALILGAAIYIAVYPVVAAKFRAIETKDVELIRKSGNKLPFLGGILNALLDYALRFV